MDDCIKNVKDCISICSTYQELYVKSQQKNKKKISKEYFNFIIQNEKINLLLPTGLCRNEKNEICIDSEVTLDKLKTLAKTCNLKNCFSLKKPMLVQFLENNILNIRNVYQI